MHYRDFQISKSEIHSIHTRRKTSKSKRDFKCTCFSNCCRAATIALGNQRNDIGFQRKGDR